MHRFSTVVRILVLALALYALPGIRADALADHIDLPAPASVEDAAYLGVPEGKPFHLTDIKAEAVLVEHFSMYCPHCQREAPVMNGVFERIQASPLAGRLKVVGVGVGNTAFETQFFREKYAVPFPLFPDEDFSQAKACHITATPTYVLLRVDGKTPKVLRTIEGRMESPDMLMDILVKIMQ